MKWWGWGDPNKRNELGPAARSMLTAELGGASHSDPGELAALSLPEAQPLPDSIGAAVGLQNVLTDHDSRALRAGGKSYPDLIRVRSGRLEAAPDAVVTPASAGEVAAVLGACSESGIAVVPFGGGTSVVGGVAPLRGSHRAVIALDLSRMRHLQVDGLSLTASLGPGHLGPQAESALGAEGLTLGHFPQSFEYASIGGFAATRSAGQASVGYGRFDDLVTSIELTTPAGAMRTLATPHTAAGPSLRELVVGSEGTLGVITSVDVRVRPAPVAMRYEGWMAEDFESGADIVRLLAQSDLLPDVTRLSDAEETRISLAMSGLDGITAKALNGYLRLRGRTGGCMLICGWEGAPDAVSRRATLARRILRRGGAAPLGSPPGDSWRHGRFEGPYLRDELMNLGYCVESLETSHVWSRYQEHYATVQAAIRAALEARGTPGIVMCHLSHAYRDGASLYYTFIAPAEAGAELDQWRAVKSAACEAIVSTGGTITHHHAVGTDHAPYMPREVGEIGVDALRAVKERLDPAGIMNPGKLIPAG